jgi:hypothetical protein
LEQVFVLLPAWIGWAEAQTYLRSNSKPSPQKQRLSDTQPIANSYKLEARS